MIEPTVGRVILYRPLDEGDEETRHAAIISQVNDDETINIGVFSWVGELYHRQNVVIVQDPDEMVKNGQCNWMPYQIGQAGKADKISSDLEEVLTDFIEQTVGRIDVMGGRILELENIILNQQRKNEGGKADGTNAPVVSGKITPPEIPREVKSSEKLKHTKE